MTDQPSGKLYSVVTKHWPRIAAGLVVAIGLVEFVVGGLTADSGVEFYLMAWAGTTGGLWFLFTQADETLTAEGRRGVADWLREADLGAGIASIPAQFALLFDRVFGEPHLTWKCFRRSCVSSFASVLIVAVLILAITDHDTPDVRVAALLVVIGAVLLNLLPDYLSLLETRSMIRYASRSGKLGRAVLLDLPLTYVIVLTVYFPLDHFLYDAGYMDFPAGWGGLFDLTILVGVISTFFTSVWLWLYAASVLLSRVLLRMNSGVGFLLRVTDVEKQPFRSMGFVSVLIVSALFALGLPLVLL